MLINELYEKFKQPLLFLIVGATCTLIQFLVLYIIVENSSAHPSLASAVGYFISTFFSYFLNYYLTFDSDVNHITGLFKYYQMALFGMALNTTVHFLLYDTLGLNYLIAQIISSAIVLISNFLISKYWIFNKSL